jgi:GTP-binding protein
MKINDVELKVLATRRSQYPEENKPEFLLVGRSNVGKSSFINTLINRKSYAKISSTPGKTKTLNFYLVNNAFYLVDVPGYGYAQVDKKNQKKFGMMIEEYLETRKNLKRVFMLIDFRHKPTEDDLLMYNFLKYHELPVTIVATKTDKVGTTHQEKQKQAILNAIDLVIGDGFIPFSNITKMGRKEVLDIIEEAL